MVLFPTIPPTVTGSTLIVTTFEFFAAQTPLFTTALYIVVTERLLYVCTELLLDNVVHVLPPSVEDSQFKILPVLPFSFKLSLFNNAQTESLFETIPASVTGSMYIIAGGAVSD